MLPPSGSVDDSSPTIVPGTWFSATELFDSAMSVCGELMPIVVVVGVPLLVTSVVLYLALESLLRREWGPLDRGSPVSAETQDP